MSKLLGMEPPHDPNHLELLKARRASDTRDPVDAEAARHMELLVQTDEKLDRIGARLDRFADELNRRKEDGEEGGIRRTHSVVLDPSPPRIGAVGTLLLVGVIAVGASTAWRRSGVPSVPRQGASGLSAGEPTPETAEPDKPVRSAAVAPDGPTRDVEPAPASQTAGQPSVAGDSREVAEPAEASQESTRPISTLPEPSASRDPQPPVPPAPAVAAAPEFPQPPPVIPVDAAAVPAPPASLQVQPLPASEEALFRREELQPPQPSRGIKGSPPTLIQPDHGRISL